METNHKIVVKITHSRCKIDVQVDKLLDYELTDIGPAHYNPMGGEIRSDTLIISTITSGLLIFMVSVAMIVFNG